MRLLGTIFRCRWGVLRLGVALFLLWALAADGAARLARVQLAALPDMDYAAEVARLSEEGRFGEAIMVADAGMATAEGPERDRLAAERDRAVAEQSSWLRKAKQLGMGALSGQGETLEALVGAVTADLFIVGDVRDVVLQGTRLAVDGEADAVILGLSGLGLATTLAPEVDWGVSLLKIGRKSGAITRGLGDFIVGAARRGEQRTLTTLAADVHTVGRRTSPGTALRVLRAADEPEDIARAAAFLERNAAGNAGALAMHVAGAEAAVALKSGARAERLLVRVAGKGEAGRAFLRGPAARVLLRPHPLIGLAKGVYKGNVEALAARIAERLDPHGWWILPLVAAWAFAEAALLWRRLANAWPGAAAQGRPALA